MLEQMENFYGLPILNNLEIYDFIFSDSIKLKNKIENYSFGLNLQSLIDLIVDESVDFEPTKTDHKTKILTEEMAVTFGVKTIHYLISDINNSRQKKLKNRLNPILDFFNNDNDQTLQLSVVNYPKIQEEDEQNYVDFKRYSSGYNQRLMELVEKIGYSKTNGQQKLQEAFYVGIFNYITILIDLYVDYNFYQLIDI